MTSTYSFDNAWNQAQARLAALEARFDPGTSGTPKPLETFRAG